MTVRLGICHDAGKPGTSYILNGSTEYNYEKWPQSEYQHSIIPGDVLCRNDKNVKHCFIFLYWVKNSSGGYDAICIEQGTGEKNELPEINLNKRTVNVCRYKLSNLNKYKLVNRMFDKYEKHNVSKVYYYTSDNKELNTTDELNKIKW